MDKDDLDRLLNSGKFLCFKPTSLKPRVAAAETEEDERKAQAPPAGEPAPELFDGALLQNAVYFKETGVDEGGDLETETRIMLSFDAGDPMQGGVSTPADVNRLLPTLKKWYGGGGDIDLSDHDRAVLTVLCRAPTFDPFILMSYRGELEVSRPIHPAYFEVDEPTSRGVQKVIESRASRLVKLALAMEENLDAPAGEGGAPSHAQPDEALLNRQRSVTHALTEAIWTTTIGPQSKSLLQSFRIQEADMPRVLFAWKGISYYEFLFRGLAKEHKDFFRWLGAPDSLPRDAHQIPAEQVRALQERRQRSIQAIRQTYLRCANLLTRYEDAYEALTNRNDPKPFQRFLLAAPKLFQGLGASIGRFGHASNAWSVLTNKGRRMRLGFARLEPFYDFILSLHADKG